MKREDTLNAQLMEAMGWTRHHDATAAVDYFTPPGEEPEYGRNVYWADDDDLSIDALVAGPEARLLALGWTLEVLWPVSGLYKAGVATWTEPPRWGESQQLAFTYNGRTEAEARARAALGALKAAALPPQPIPSSVSGEGEGSVTEA